MKPVDQQSFWNQRLYNVIAKDRGIYAAVYDTDPANWELIQRRTGEVLADRLKLGNSLLDVGCGYGSVVDVLPPVVSYYGVDISEDFIRLARLRYPTKTFYRLDMRNDLLKFLGNKRFDFALCRSVKQTLELNLPGVWPEVEREVRRVAKELIILEYDELEKQPLVHEPPRYVLSPESFHYRDSFAVQATGLFDYLKDRPSSFLEIGVYQGGSACWLLDRFPQLHYVGIDDNIRGEAIDNLAMHGSRALLISGDSKRVLFNLCTRFDGVYIDGEHSYEGVLSDLTLSWERLVPGGIILCDDYDNVEYGVRSAVDNFLVWKSEALEVVRKGYTIAMRKVP